MAEYRVELDTYSGPLDLLLYLVRRHEVDLNDIRIADLTEQYLDYVDRLERVDFDNLTDFLVMAAMLLEIKSAMLAAGLDEIEEDADGVSVGASLGGESDPRFELVRQLLEYKRYKDAADAMHERFVAWQQRFASRPAGKTHPVASQAGDDADGSVAEAEEFDLEDANVLELCEAYVRVLESVGQTPQTTSDHKIIYDDTPIALHAEDLVDCLKRNGAMALQDIFVGRSNRGEMVGLFLATLELVRSRRVRVSQDDTDGRIHLELCCQDGQPTVLAESAPVWRDPKTGEIDYDWPIESLRERARKRAERRVAHESDTDDTANTHDDSTDPIAEPVGAGAEPIPIGASAAPVKVMKLKKTTT